MPAGRRPGTGWFGLASTLAAFSGGEILLTLLYQWYFLNRLGAGTDTDAFYAGMMVPQLVLVVVTSALTQVLVPLLTVQDEDTFIRTVWTFAQGIAIAFGATVLVAWLSATAWVPLTVPGFTKAGSALTVELVRVQLLGLVFGALVSVFWSARQAQRQFVRAAVAPLVGAAVGLGLLWWGLPRYGVIAAAWATVFRAAIQLVFLVPGTGRYYLPKWRTPVTREAWRRIRPLLSRSVYFKADIIVDRFLGALAPPGSLSLLTLARQLYTAGLQVMNRALTGPMVPELAHIAERRAWTEFRRVRNAHVARATVLAFGFTLFVVALGRPVLSRFFGRSFNPEQIHQAWWLLLLLSGVWLGGVVCQMLAGALYAQGDTDTPTRIGVVSFTVGSVLKVLGFFAVGVGGIAVGASLHYVIMLLLLLRVGGRPTAAPPAHQAEDDAAQYSLPSSGS